MNIAIVGIACRFPQAKNKEEFWEKLCQGKELIDFFSENELTEVGNDIQTIKNPNYVRARGTFQI